MIINETLANHSIVVEALHRLTLVMVRQNNPYHEPVNTELIDMFVDLAQKDKESDVSAISKLSTSGDLERVSEELYNPSSNIFDSEGYTSFFAKPEIIEGEIPTSSFSGDNDISCSSCYTVKYDNKVYALIKNYHTLNIIDYSETSWNYPLLVIDEMNSIGQTTGGKLGNPTTVEFLDSAGAITGISFPISVIYTTYNIPFEAMDSSGAITGISFPISVVYSTYNNPFEAMDSSGAITDISFPLTVGYITYNIPHEGIDSTGTIDAISLT